MDTKAPFNRAVPGTAHPPAGGTVTPVHELAYPAAPSDFCHAAAAETQRLLAAHAAAGLGQDPLAAPFSVCLPTSPADRQRLAAMGKRNPVMVIASFSMLGLSFLAAISLPILLTLSPPLAVVGVVLALLGPLVGMAVGVIPVLGSIPVIRQVVGRRLRDAGDPLADLSRMRRRLPWRFRPRVIWVEEATTYRRMKSTPEDFALLLMEPELGLVRVEGLAYRHVIRWHDVLEVRQVRGGLSVATLVHYRVGEATVAMTLQGTGVGALAPLQLWSSLLKPLRRSLSPPRGG